MSMRQNKCIGNMTSIINLPSPLFAKEGQDTSLWQREDRRDFIIEGLLLMNSFVSKGCGKENK